MLPEFEAPSESRRAIKTPHTICAILIKALIVACNGNVNPCMVHVRSDVNLQMPHAKTFLAPNSDSTKGLIVLQTSTSPRGSFAAPPRMHIAGEIALRSRGRLGPLRCLRAFNPLLGPVPILKRFSSQCCKLRAISVAAMTAGEHFLQEFVNYEAKGVPDKAGTDTKDGFDLVTASTLPSGEIGMYATMLSAKNKILTSTLDNYWLCRAA